MSSLSPGKEPFVIHRWEEML